MKLLGLAYGLPPNGRRRDELPTAPADSAPRHQKRKFDQVSSVLPYNSVMESVWLRGRGACRSRPRWEWCQKAPSDKPEASLI